MPRQHQTYTQRLPALGLSIERNTPGVANDGFFYLLRDGEVLGRYRSLPAAKAAWQQVVDASGWRPPKREELSPEDKLRREKLARERADYFEYWNSGRRRAW